MSAPPENRTRQAAGRGGFSGVVRVLLVWLLSALGLAALDRILPGFGIRDARAAVAAAALLGLLNALVWPLLVRLALPLTVLTSVWPRCFSTVRWSHWSHWSCPAPPSPACQRASWSRSA